MKSVIKVSSALADTGYWEGEIARVDKQNNNNIIDCCSYITLVIALTKVFSVECGKWKQDGSRKAELLVFGFLVPSSVQSALSIKQCHHIIGITFEMYIPKYEVKNPYK